MVLLYQGQHSVLHNLKMAILRIQEMLRSKLAVSIKLENGISQEIT